MFRINKKYNRTTPLASDFEVLDLGHRFRYWVGILVLDLGLGSNINF